MVRLDGSVPVRYGLRLNMDARYSAVKQQLQLMSGVHEASILICELAEPLVQVGTAAAGTGEWRGGGSAFTHLYHQVSLLLTNKRRK